MDQQKLMNRLRREWGLSFALGLAGLIALAALLFIRWSPLYAAAWLALPLLGISYLFAVCYRNLAQNHRPGERALLPDFGWGNRLTLARGVFVSALLGFLVIPHAPGWLSWIPGVLYTLSCAADFFDGYAARVTDHATPLGETLDLSFDGIGVLAAVLLAVQYGQVPAWYLAIGVARYLFLAGIWLRRRMGLAVFDLPPRLDRRVFAGLQMGFLAATLWPVFAPPGTHIAAALFGMPLLFGFTRDWLYVSGVVDPQAETPTGVNRFAARWLPVGLRLLILALNLSLILPWLQIIDTLPAIPLAVGLLNLLAALLLVLGVLPRVASIAALCALGFSQVFGPLTDAQIILAVAYTLILYIGSGAFSLWTPEDYLYRNHAGKRKKFGVEAEA